MKQNILNLNAEIINNEKPRIEFRAIYKNEIREELKVIELIKDKGLENFI